MGGKSMKFITFVVDKKVNFSLFSIIQIQISKNTIQLFV